MKNMIRKVFKILIWGGMIFLIFNIFLYGYCYMTPKLSINKEQSYYLYDSEGKLIFDEHEDWISLDEISPYLVEATIYTNTK